MKAAIVAALAVGLFAGVAVSSTSPAVAAEMRHGGGGMGGGGGFRGFHGGGFRGPSMHFGGGHFGGARFAHFGGAHFGGLRFGGRHAFGSRFGFAGSRFGHGARFGSRFVGHSFAGRSRVVTGFAGRAAFANSARAFGFRHGQFGERGFRSGFVGWAGPVFWPYAYDDLFDYAFWPFDVYWPYDALFWAYGYDDLFAGVLLPYGYAGSYGYASSYGQEQPPAQGGAQPGGSGASSSPANLCGTAGAVPEAKRLDRIAAAVDPTTEQRAKLDALGAASAKAEKALAASCATQTPPTALGRLDAVQTRLQAMTQAVDAVKGPLDDFYGSLTDEQKAHLNQLGETQNTVGQASSAPPNLAALCGPQNAVPVVAVERIDRVVRPNGEQRAALTALSDAAHKADAAIVATCPSQPPLTPPVRLAAVRGRLQAMLDGVGTVRPSLQAFYDALSPEQKSRFDAMGSPASGATPRS